MPSSADLAHDFSAFQQSLNFKQLGAEMHDRIRQLYPICRSITGDGLRQTLRIIGREIDLQAREVPTGTSVFDWTVPKEWNIRDAYVKDSRGHRIIDFKQSNLHVLNYSVPVRQRMNLDELRPHLFSIPEHPDWIPYKTSYYSPNWGFCLSHRQLEGLQPDEYEVCIDSSLKEGHMTLGECYIPGRDPGEILFSCHVCHPSLCNDNLSGVSLAVSLAKCLAHAPLRHSYRFLFVPGTIGAIAWLALNEPRLELVRAGLVLSCLGDSGTLTYKRSRQGHARVDRALEYVLTQAKSTHSIVDFSPYGYDERQYCSPGINLPVGSLSRTPHGAFPQYHTSADNPDFVRPEALSDSLATCLKAVEVLDGDALYLNQHPKCEPQLGRRGLYSNMGGHSGSREYEMALLWVLNLSDGQHTLLDIAERAGLPFGLVRDAASALVEHDLLAGDAA